MLNDIRIVLVETTHPGNIGATARAMKNMGLQNLFLVNPYLFPHSEAVSRAAGADDILQQAKICSSLNNAIADCHLVLATSARARSFAWPTLMVRDAAKVAINETKQQHKIAIVFGRESSGLTNEELTLCHYQVYIPCNPEFSSLNLGAAVQIISYELFMANSQPIEEKMRDAVEVATHEEIADICQQLQETMEIVGYLNPNNPRHFLMRWRRLLLQGRLEKIEVDMLKGMFKSIRNKVTRM